MTEVKLPLSLKQSLEATKVSYTQLGKSGLRVSVPVLGAMSFGHKDWAPWVVGNEEEVEALLKGAYDRGLNTWDTANVYSNGVSEEMIGRVIKKYNLPRHKLVILTKCYGTVGEEPGVRHIQFPKEMSESKDYINQGGLSRAAIFNAVEASLRRLQTDYIDLLQIHVSGSSLVRCVFFDQLPLRGSITVRVSVTSTCWTDLILFTFAVLSKIDMLISLFSDMTTTSPRKRQ
jgi:aryl-alcohol dehydrogenase-like predicted oxidoreductase